MKVTKKSRLLAGLKRARIKTFEIRANRHFSITGVNFEGTVGFNDMGDPRTFPVTLAKSNGKSMTALVGQESSCPDPELWTGLYEEPDLAVGDEVTISFSTDPAKTEWKTETISKSGVVTE